MAWQGARIWKKKLTVTTEGPVATNAPVPLNDFYRELYRSLDIKQSGPRRSKRPVGDIPDNAFTGVTFGGVKWDTGGFTKAEQIDRLIVPADGNYRLIATWASGAGIRLGAFLYAWIVRSDAECLDMSTMTMAGQDNKLPLLAYDGPLKTGDFLRLVLLHAQGKPLPESYYEFGTWMSISTEAGVPGPTPPNPNPTPTPVPHTEADNGTADDDPADGPDGDE